MITLKELSIRGDFRTTVEYLIRLLETDVFKNNRIDTAWLDVPQTEVVAVADDDKSGLAAVAKRLQVEKAFTDYREMLDQVDIDIVAICSRWIDKHHEMAVAAAERGMHIYMESHFAGRSKRRTRLWQHVKKHTSRWRLATPLDIVR